MRSCSYHIWLRQRLTMLWQGKYTLLGSSAYLKLSPEVLCFLTHMLLMGHVDVSKHTCCVSHPLQKERPIKQNKTLPKVCCLLRGWRWYPLSSAIHWSQRFGRNMQKLYIMLHHACFRTEAESYTGNPSMTSTSKKTFCNSARPVSWLLLTILQSKFIKCKSFHMIQGVTEAVQLRQRRHFRVSTSTGSATWEMSSSGSKFCRT